MKAHTKETQQRMTPEKALEELKKGNERFQKNKKADRDLLEQVSDTSNGQYPFATILSCIDSRVSS
ncbi:MAG: carbonic anhydrase, partial [Flavobacteriaceae bacterium]|nr:carbonic anhydrase [Flavobacteriaceae bacterium]